MVSSSMPSHSSDPATLNFVSSLMASPVHQVPHNLDRDDSTEFVEDVDEFDQNHHNDAHVSVDIEGSSQCVEVEQTEAFSVFISPSGSKIWIPSVPVEIKPVIGTVFYSWEQVMYFYGRYAKIAGFSVRVGQSKKWKGVVTNKYLRCNKAGKPQYKRKFDVTHEDMIRQCTYTQCDCEAQISVSICRQSGSFKIIKFNEHHNHCLIDNFNQDLSKVSRKLTFSTKQFIHNMSLNRIGPVKAHRVMVSLMGGHHKVNGTPTDFKNFSQSVRMYIGDRDSQILIDRLTDRSKEIPEFYFDYYVSDGKLQCMFWADEVSKLNYKKFGDVVSFDATYQTNRYNMIFVPFTGVNNHKLCVSFGAGLILSETTESYKWLLQQFLQAHGKQPTLVLTDQDPAMRQAILQVWRETRHRYCIWHIMRKLPAKIAPDLLQNSTLRSSLHRLVWSIYMKPETFETRWQELIVKYSLQNINWLKEMYAVRERWVPAYFRDLPMCCLLKTTSCSESTNASFKVNSTSANTLVQFMLCFETVVESQRYRNRAADFKSNNRSFFSESGLLIEKDAFDIYTQAVFKDVQKEICRGKHACFISDTEFDADVFVYSVSHLCKRNAVKHTFKVNFDKRDKSCSCSCMSFTRIGYLCRHIFHIYRVNQVEKIPNAYIFARWRKDALPKRIFDIENRYGVDTSLQSTTRNEILELVAECVDSIRSDTKKLVSFANNIREIKSKLFETPPSQSSSEDVNLSIIEELVGQSIAVEPTVSNPPAVQNKGRGKVRRMIPPAENQINKPPKVARLCKNCNKYVTTHDSRNCKKWHEENGAVEQGM
ncbi:hypothetical protein SSX86_010231 [Deinandra increscens subsp. villosa]|uniref:SWIM-type domain-containing protein n=1 Tax=Deinandra increscens subsp. villosa TaxID=3103831 RepID=A0AAP0D761_9ASTR